MTPKFSLTINTNDPGDVSRILAAIGGHVTLNASTDDDGDAAPVAGYVAPERDSTGLPWDARIHAKSKTTNKDGTWKSARGVDAATVAAVEAELRALIAPPMPTAAAAPVMQAQPVAMPTAAAAPVMQAQPVAAPVMQAQPTALDFNGFMFGLQKGMTANLIDMNVLNWLVQNVNAQAQTQFAQITDLATRPDVIPLAVGILRQHGKWVE